MIAPRRGINESFYNQAGVQPKDILYGAVKVPESRVTLLPEVYDKLKKLAKGIVADPTNEDKLAVVMAAKCQQGIA